MLVPFPFHVCSREAWKALGDMSPEQAMREYIATVKKVDPAWNPQVYLISATISCCGQYRMQPAGRTLLLIGFRRPLIFAASLDLKKRE